MNNCLDIVWMFYEFCSKSDLDHWFWKVTQLLTRFTVVWNQTIWKDMGLHCHSTVSTSARQLLGGPNLNRWLHVWHLGSGENHQVNMNKHEPKLNVLLFQQHFEMLWSESNKSICEYWHTTIYMSTIDCCLPATQCHVPSKRGKIVIN